MDTQREGGSTDALIANYPHIIAHIGGLASAEISILTMQVRRLDPSLSSLDAYLYAAAEWLSDYYDEARLLRNHLVYLEGEAPSSTVGDLSFALHKVSDISISLSMDIRDSLPEVLQFRAWIKSQLPDGTAWWRAYRAAKRVENS